MSGTKITYKAFAEIINLFPEGNIFHLPILLAYRMGLSLQESLAITWKDVDLEKGTVNVRRNVKNLGRQGDWYLVPAENRRIIFLEEPIKSLLKRTKDAQEADRERYGSRYFAVYSKEEWDSEGNSISRLVNIEQDIPVFLPRENFIHLWRNGLYLNPNHFNKCMEAINKELGVNITFDALICGTCNFIPQEDPNLSVPELKVHSSVFEKHLVEYFERH